LPIKVASVGATSPVSVRVTVLNQALTKAARGAGVSFIVRRTDDVGASGPVRVTVDYSKWRHLAGANFADRLAIRPRSMCEVFSPESACAPVGYAKATNDLAAGTLTFEVAALPDPAAAEPAAPASPEPTAAATATPTPAPATTAATAATADDTSGALRAMAVNETPAPTGSTDPTPASTDSPASASTDAPSDSNSAATDSAGLDPLQSAVCDATTDPSVEQPSWCTADGAAPDEQTGQQAVVFSTTSTASGSSGTYAVANVVDPVQWAGGMQSGDFTYDYSLKMPPSIGGDVCRPQVGR
jgi:hypothetical protein